MRKFVLIIIILLTINIIFPFESIAAGKVQTAEITKIENDLYGFDYSNDELKNRIARLEKTIYGKSLDGDLNSRIKRISEDTLSEQIGQEITPSEDTFLAEEEADSTVSYPVVDEIERRLFNTTYPKRDFHTRIVTIERKLFGKIYDIEDYSTRMDRIKTAVMPESLVTDSNRFNYDENAINSSELSGINNNRFSGFMPYGQRKLTRPYVNYGENGTYADSPIYNSDSLNEELAKLEFDTFGTEFSNEDTKTRIKRLNSVNKAKKSSRKYDSQKFQQHMSTAMEIGAMILMILAMVL